MRKPWDLSMAAGLRTVDAAQARRSLARVAGLAVETVCFGHGKPLVRNANRRLAAFLSRTLAG